MHTRVLFVGRPRQQRMLRELSELLETLCQQDFQVFVDEQLAEVVPDVADTGAVITAESEAADYVIVLGGDGAFLSAARRFAPLGARLIGVNFGYLGFLTDIASDNMREAVLKILAGDCEDETRSMLSVRINGAPLSGDLSACVNDVVISRGGAGVLLSLCVFINNNFAYDLRADGLIVSTPSGSTAYALSSGGPIVSPSVDATLLVPLCPHSLTHRPLTVPADFPIRLEILEAQSATLHIDGRGDIRLNVGDTVELSRHPTRLSICHPKSYNYYQTLRKKLLWGE